MYIEYVWYVYLTISIHVLSTYFYLLSDLISLPQIYRGTKGNISMNDKSIVDIDEEGHFLIPAGINNIHSLQLFGQTYILFKFITASNSFVIYFLSEIMVKLELQFFYQQIFIMKNDVKVLLAAALNICVSYQYYLPYHQVTKRLHISLI